MSIEIPLQNKNRPNYFWCGRGQERSRSLPAEHLAHDCAWEAETRGITKADLIEAAGGDLNVYMRAELNRVFNREVEDRVAQVS
jgi:hypothetical protein